MSPVAELPIPPCGLPRWRAPWAELPRVLAIALLTTASARGQEPAGNAEFGPQSATYLGAADPGSTVDALGRLAATVRNFGHLRAAHGRWPIAGPSWHEPERHRDGSLWCWMRGSGAQLELRAFSLVDSELWLQVLPADFLPEVPQLSVRIHGVDLQVPSLSPGPQWVQIHVPAQALRRGSNRIELTASAAGAPADHLPGSADDRPLALKLARASLVPRRSEATEPPPLPALAPGAPSGDGMLLAPGQLTRLHAWGREDAVAEFWVRSEGERSELLFEVTRPSTGTPVLRRTVQLGPEPTRLRVPLAREGRGAALSIVAPHTSPAPALFLAATLDAALPSTNVVLVVCDTLRADHFHGEVEGIFTPNFDRLRAEGIAFERAYTHSPLTLPAHTALFSARAPHATGVTNNWQNVPKDLPLFAEWLRWLGYSTHSVSSLGTLWSPHARLGIDRGFETYSAVPDIAQATSTTNRISPLWEVLEDRTPFFLFAHFSDPHEPYNVHGDGREVALLEVNGTPVREVSLDNMTLGEFEVELAPGESVVELRAPTDFMVKRLEVRADGNLLHTEVIRGQTFEALQHFAVRVHVPARRQVTTVALWVHDLPTVEEVRLRYRREVEYFDQALGQLIENLEARGLWNDTLFVFTADHGELIGEDGHVGHASFLDQAVVRVPLLIKLPAGHPMELRLREARTHLASHRDVVPTILHTLALPALPGAEGRSLFFPRDTVHVAEAHPPESVEQMFVITDGKHKLWHYPERGEWRLYDLGADPHERRDILHAHPEFFERWSKHIPTSADNRASDGGAPDAATLERLRALGYLGG